MPNDQAMPNLWLMDWEAKAEAARRRYNELYPDRPINQIGDTLEVHFFLFAFSGSWENGKPLTDREIASVAMITPPGCFS
ncbi:hypothetical protein [Rhizobium sp. N4311]|uniref:hypothetical protein n=1 Tax=Rhizobium sp. N4311 TaxID=1703972 RepID=UPI00117B1EAF|nr:hypothetical protein [Rhizobium sp. N4311]